MKSVEVIFLDFDGIILESVDIKGWAFGKLFEGYPEIVPQVVAYHHAHGGVSRYDKFKYFYKEFLKEPLSDDKFQALCADFSALVFNRVLSCEFVKGALEFLEKYYQKCALYIISGTPDEEIKKVVEMRKLDKFVKGVFGSPASKGSLTEKILEQEKFDPKYALWVGDARSDQRAAEENNIRFVGRVTGGKDIFLHNKIEHRIEDMFQLDEFMTR